MHHLRLDAGRQGFRTSLFRARAPARVSGKVDPRPHHERRFQQASRVVQGTAPGLVHFARRAVFRFQDPGHRGQVLLRVGGRAHRLHRLAQELVRSPGQGLARILELGALPLYRQGHHPLPLPLLARHAPHRGHRRPRQGVRARLSHGQRREDVQVQGHVRQRAHLSRQPAGRRASLLLRGQARRHGRRYRPQPRRFRAAGQFRSGGQNHQHRLARRPDAPEEAGGPARRVGRGGPRARRKVPGRGRDDRRLLRG